MKVSVVQHGVRSVPRAFVRAWCKGVDREISRAVASRTLKKRLAECELTIAFFDTKRARTLNKRFRGKDYATDVLSFEAIGEPASLGELAICLSVVSRQAKEHGLSLEDELGYVVLHGILHLLGYEHERSKRAAKEMFALQDRVFDRLCASGQPVK